MERRSYQETEELVERVTTKVLEQLTSNEHIEEIADRAAERALEKVYTGVGKSVVTKTMWLVGVVVISLFFWLAAIGEIKP